MAKEPIDAPEQQLEGWEAVEQKFVQNQNLVVGILAGVILVLGGIYGYNNLVLKPKEAKAANSIFAAEAHFAKDSMRLALYGDNINPGFVSIADKYGATSSGKMAAGYAAICFLQQGDFNNAIKYGKKYNSEDGWMNSRVYEVVGHAYTENADYDNGVKYYRMAAEASDNEITAPYNYYLAGMAAMEKKDFSEANRFFQIIKDNYPTSREGQSVDKFLALTGS